MYEPATIGAIDAGTNAIRVVVARTQGPGEYVRIHKERWPVRLGHNVYTRQSFDSETIEQATDAFRHFSDLFDRYEVDQYRAVATSATRQADNREVLLGRLKRESDIDLEVIDGREEARLTHGAIRHWLDETHRPELVVDIGGGSLELLIVENGEVVDTTSLPLGTVRLMETFGVYGSIDVFDAEMLRRYVETMLQAYADCGDLRIRGAVGAGGNVESLADIYQGGELYGYDSLDLGAMSRDLDRVTRLGIRQRMELFGVRRDRAEVMAIAAIVLSALGKTFGVERLSAPDVGVREGVLLELSRRTFSADQAPDFERRRENLLDSCREFARRLHCPSEHTEHVCRIAGEIFDECAEHHEMGRRERLVLECAALMHEIGYAVQRSGRHKHAAYLIENGQLHGLRGWMRQMVAVVTRHHRSAFPAPRHARFMSLDETDRPKALKLSAILRIADGLDTNFNQLVDQVDLEVDGTTATLELDLRADSELPALGAAQKGHLFEVAFGLEPNFEVVSSPTARMPSGDESHFSHV